MGVVVAVVGVIGYLGQKRRGSEGDVRRFLKFYALGVPFLACVLTAGLYPRWRWLYFVAGAIAVLNAVMQFRAQRRGRRRF